ncbi:MAG: hypothetical protein QM778_04990 [Myxococcales bacterium]
MAEGERTCNEGEVHEAAVSRETDFDIVLDDVRRPASLDEVVREVTPMLCWVGAHWPSRVCIRMYRAVRWFFSAARAKRSRA